MSTFLTRADLAQLTGGNLKLIKGLEDIQSKVASTAVNSANNVAATQAIADASVITLSSNDALTNEFVLQVADPLAIDASQPGKVTLGLSFSFTVTQAYSLNINLVADTTVTFPSSGRLLSSTVSSAAYANDAAAATAGVSVGEAYRASDGTLRWRQT